MSESRTVYLAGPMRGYPEFNFPAFDRWRDKLKAQGFNVISPADMDREAGFDPASTGEEDITNSQMRDFMSRDCEGVLQSDAIALMPGWQNSKGAMLEFRLACLIGIPAIDVVDFGEYQTSGDFPERLIPMRDGVTGRIVTYDQLAEESEVAQKVTVEVGVEFAGGDNETSKEALRLQRLGAKFECRNKDSDYWSLPEYGASYSFVSWGRYRMVSPPPVTLEIGEDFTSADVGKCEYAKELQEQGAKFETRWGVTGDWGAAGDDLHFDYSSRLHYRLASFPPEPQPEPSTPFEVGKCYANGNGGIFEVTSVNGEKTCNGIPQSIETMCVLEGEDDDVSFLQGVAERFYAGGQYYIKGESAYDLIPVEVPHPEDTDITMVERLAEKYYEEHPSQPTISESTLETLTDRIENDEIVDDRQTFASGAVRSSDAAGTRYDLISHIGLRRIAETYAEGADKYDDNNWLKGFPASDVINHCIRHIFKWLGGDTTEDHLAHAAWNLIAVMHFEETKPELIDCHHRQADKQTG